MLKPFEVDFEDGEERKTIEVNKLTIIINNGERDVEYKLRLTNESHLELIKSTYDEESSSVSITPSVSNHIYIK